MPLIARAPRQRLTDLVGALGGTWHGRTALCRCPAHRDRNPSLSLRQGDVGILVTCFAGCRREDVLTALARIPFCGHYPLPADLDISGTARVARLWDEAWPVGDDPARRYLNHRGFAIMPPDIRYHPRCPHGPRPKTIFAPALLVAVRQRRTLVAVQRIFLSRAVGGYSAKANLGRMGQGAWQGTPAGPVLAIAEGFETAAAFSLLHKTPCWASLGARRLDQIAIPPQVRAVIIAADNDPEGVRAASRACRHYEALDFEARSCPPPHRFNDWADVLKSQMKRGGGVAD